MGKHDENKKKDDIQKPTHIIPIGINRGKENKKFKFGPANPDKKDKK